MTKAPSVTWLHLVLRIMAIPLLFAGIAGLLWLFEWLMRLFG
jgi:hypothetical protein